MQDFFSLNILFIRHIFQKAVGAVVVLRERKKNEKFRFRIYTKETPQILSVVSNYPCNWLVFAVLIFRPCFGAQSKREYVYFII